MKRHKGYKVALDESGRFVIVDVNTDVTLELGLEFARASSEEARRHSVRGILVDVRDARSSQNAFGQYELARRIFEEGVDRRLRVAGVVAPWDHSHDFVETALRNRGFDVRFFRDLETARSWLSDPAD